MVKAYIRSFLKKKIKSNDGNLDLRSFEFVSTPFEDVQTLIAESPGGWSIDKRVSQLLIGIFLKEKPNKVVEFGAGYSTLVFKYLLEKSGQPYELHSFEQNAEWFKIPGPLKALFNGMEVKLKIATIKFKIGYLGIYARYEPEDKGLLPLEFDLQLVDGPQYYYGREGALDFTYNKLKPGALILMDDSERYTEQCVIFKWLKIYRGLDLIYLNEKFGDKGLAILKVRHPLKKTFSFSAFSLGVYQGTKRFWNLNFGHGKSNKYVELN